MRVVYVLSTLLACPIQATVIPWSLKMLDRIWLLLGPGNKRVRNLAVSKEPWDISEVIRDKHRINKNIPGLGPQKKYSSRATSAAEKVCLSRMTPNWRHGQMKYRTRLLGKCYVAPCSLFMFTVLSNKSHSRKYSQNGMGCCCIVAVTGSLWLLWDLHVAYWQYEVATFNL